jgi:hypothetical protein
VGEVVHPQSTLQLSTAGRWLPFRGAPRYPRFASRPNMMPATRRIWISSDPSGSGSSDEGYAPVVTVDVLEGLVPCVPDAAVYLDRCVRGLAHQPICPVVAHRDLVADVHVVMLVHQPRGLVDEGAPGHRAASIWRLQVRPPRRRGTRRCKTVAYDGVALAEVWERFPCSCVPDSPEGAMANDRGRWLLPDCRRFSDLCG